MLSEEPLGRLAYLGSAEYGDPVDETFQLFELLVVVLGWRPATAAVGPHMELGIRVKEVVVDPLPMAKVCCSSRSSWRRSFSALTFSTSAAARRAFPSYPSGSPDDGRQDWNDDFHRSSVAPGTDGKLGSVEAHERGDDGCCVRLHRRDGVRVAVERERHRRVA
jgi:hypothetical protein